MLQLAQSSWWACHRGVARTLHPPQAVFLVALHGPDVLGFVTACLVCARGKTTYCPPAGLLCLIPIPSRHRSHIVLDFVTGLPPSGSNTTILTIVSRFSKAVHFVPLTRLPSTSETAQLLVQHVFCLCGIPSDLVLNWGTQFTLGV